MKQIRTDRRGFLRQVVGAAAGAVAFPYIIPSSVLGKAGSAPPSNRIVVGCIGVGSQGTGDMRRFLAEADVQIVAVCDLKRNVCEQAKRRVDERNGNSDCRMYHDFRELAAREDIDAVLDATCDHWHVLTALAAVRSRKDVYLEKPMGMSLEEDQALRAACYQYDTVFQFGTQQRSDSRFRQACELAVNGRLGKVHTINVLSPPSVAGGPLDVAPVPEWLDYEMWLGPAPYKPYTTERCSNKYWWFHSDYALGWIGGWGVHPLDIALWGGGKALEGKVTLEGRGTFPRDGFCDTATEWRILMKYDSGVTLDYAGGPQPAEWFSRYGKDAHGVGFEGTDGWVHVNRGRITASDKKLLETPFGPGDVGLGRNSNHVRNFLDCVKSRRKTVSHIDSAVQADILCQLSDIAIRTERKIAWNPVKEEIIGDEEASRRLRRSMRSPWHL